MEVSKLLDFDYSHRLFINRSDSGRPRPEVSWWLDDKLVDHTYVGTSENVVQNVLVIQQLERRHLHAVLRCQASNYFGVHNNTPPYYTTTTYGHQQQHRQQQQQQHQQHTIVSSVQLDLNRKSSAYFLLFFFQGISFQSALLSAHLKRIHRADNLFFFFSHDRSGLRDYLAETELKCFSFFFDVTLGSRTRLHLVSIREKKKWIQSADPPRSGCLLHIDGLAYIMEDIPLSLSGRCV